MSNNEIVSVTLEDFSTTDKFDIVSLFDVLEHLINPMEIINQVSKKRDIDCRNHR